MSERAAQAVGFLEATPFVDLLVHAFDHRLTGTLVLEEPGGLRHGVYFEAGTPRKAKTASAIAPLGEVLVETGVITEDVQRRTLARALEEHLLLGRVLVEDGAISEQALAFGLREQLLRQMLWLFERPQGTRFGYFDGSNFLEDWGAEPIARVSVMELLWRGLRDHARPEEIQAVLGRLGQRPIVLREDMPLDYFYFMGSDREAVELLRRSPRELEELLDQLPAQRDVIERVVCLLLLARAVDLGTRSAPPLGVEASAETSPWSLPPGEMPYVPTALDAHDEASEPAAVSTPIPVAEAEICIEDDAAQSPQEEDEARAVEASNGRKSHSDHSQEQALAAAAAFRKAEALLAHGHLAKAEVEARFALQNEPGQAEYVALCAWIDVLKPNADSSKINLELRRALRLAENNAKVHWYRGLVLQHLGRHEYALREFRTVLDLDPRHLDAARQIRVYEMRLEHSPRGRPSLAPEPDPTRLGWFRRKR
jgi:tetratricopeptide (TPR) repeat protein